CEENHLTLTGHFHQEGGLFSQTHTNGDVMRGYVYFQMPGMDVLRDDIELTTAKQVQSVVNQYGGKGMMSEEYGVTNWDFDFRGHKFQGDWQAALGVTVRVPHLTWMSMKGSAKRDYPASIGLQSPWYTEYSYIENHFARLNYALQDTKVEIHVGVIHPIESFWLYWGTDTQTGDKRCQREKEFSNLVEWLLLGLVDFDFINEALLNSAPGPIEAKEYDTIIVPNCKILRKTTVEFLEKYQKSGGKVLFLEEKPEYIDAEQKSISEICPGAEVMAFAKEAVLDSLKDCRVVDIRQDGERCNNLLCSIRENSDGKWLFIAHGKKHENRYTSQAQNIEIQIKGEYLPTMYDTITGEVKPLVYEWIAGKTIIQDKLYEFDSILIRLEKEVRTAGMQKEKMQPVICGEEMIPDTVSYELEEPNVLLLDRAEYSYMTEEIAPFEEVLRIDSKCRERAGLPPTGAKLLQPWCEKDEKNYGCVRLIFHIDSEIELEKAWLAFEEAEEILLNDMPVVMDICGYYVDDAIKKVKLPKLYKGENILRVSVPFGKRRSVEPMYLLGDFGVKVKGTDIRLTEKTKLLEFCTVTKQGFPFYGGNIIYHWRVEAKQDCIAKITVPYYVGALVKVWIDEKATGVIVNPPYSLMADMEQGIHDIRLQLFGNRHNTFGSLHNCSDDTYYGPPHWLAKGEAWTYEYLIKDMGILKKPVIELYAKN
ncbi:MAG: hypothetical protein J6J86_02480, partial [Lachnospiraceae bacterium]|nr:hypothetical protein [Lachnospiraceae bacterium]